MKIGQNLKLNNKWLLLTGVITAISLVCFALVNHALAQSNRPAPSTGPNERIINIYDRGQEKVIITKARTVRQALKSADVEINYGWDVVEPGLDTELADTKYNINIYRARPVTVVDGSMRKRLTTAQQTPDLIVKAAKLTLHKEDQIELKVAHDLLTDGIDTVVEIDRAAVVNFTIYGKRTELRTQSETVGELLKEKNIVLKDQDVLSVAPGSKIASGMSIELWRDGKQTVTQEEEIDFPVEKIQDANRPMGFSEVKTPGEKGKKNVTYEIEMKNGQEVSRKEIASVVAVEPKKQVEVIGVKPGNGLTKSKGVFNFVDSNGVSHRETYYDLPMSIVMGNCGGGGVYTVRAADGAKVDKDGYVIIAAHLGNYPRCSVVETSLGPGKVYDTGGFTSKHPHGFDLATDWTKADGI